MPFPTNIKELRGYPHSAFAGPVWSFAWLF